MFYLPESKISDGTRSVKCKSALLYHAGGLGDFVLSLPAIFRVAGTRPGVRWSYWGPSDRLALLPGFGRAPGQVLRLGHTLWGNSSDRGLVDLLKECEVILAFGGGAPPAWAGMPGLRSLPLASFPPTRVRVPEYQRRQLDAFGVPRVAAPWLPGWRAVVLSSRNPGAIVLHPGSGDPKKNLPAEVWRDTLEALRRRTGLPAFLALGPAELERGGWEALAGVVDGVESCDSLQALLAILGRAALYLGNDAGPSHLASALGIPAVIVFGPSDPAIWHPLGPRVRAVRQRLPCAPCTSGGPIRCDDPRCVRAVRAEELVEAALEWVG